MAPSHTRYPVQTPTIVDASWTLERLTPPSRLFGANGIRTGPDGRIYVAQVSGSQISAVDVATGQVDTISALGGEIVAPDDLAFDSQGNLYATEITEGRVSVRTPSGQTRVLYDNLPCANPITWHQGRLLAGECLHSGRIVELDLNGGSPRLIADNLPMPNAMEVGPDGMLYFPVMGANEIWRVRLDGGTPEKVADNLGVPDAVKFDSQGRIVSTQAATGEVLRIDPRTGERVVLASLAPGLDNLTFVDERLFVSSFSGQISEILAGGQTRSLLPEGLNGPLGLTVATDGTLLVADGPYCYHIQPGHAPKVAGMLFTPGSPGYTRGLATFGPGEYIVTTATGQVARWRPAHQESTILADGLERPYGVATDSKGTVIVADAGTGKLLSIRAGRTETLATRLSEPKGVAIAPDGSCLVTEEGAGRVVRIVRGKAETVLDGLHSPHGLLVRGDHLYVVDPGSKELIEFDFTGQIRRTLAAQLPIGAPPGVTPKFLRPFLPLSGSMGPFTGLAGGPDGTLYLSADAEGSVLALRPGDDTGH